MNQCCHCIGRYIISLSLNWNERHQVIQILSINYQFSNNYSLLFSVKCLCLTSSFDCFNMLAPAICCQQEADDIAGAWFIVKQRIFYGFFSVFISYPIVHSQVTSRMTATTNSNKKTRKRKQNHSGECFIFLRLYHVYRICLDSLRTEWVSKQTQKDHFQVLRTLVVGVRQISNPPLWKWVSFAWE